MNPHDSQIHCCAVWVLMRGRDSIGGRMEADRPAPGEVLHTGTPTVPRQAASVIVLRGGDETLEVLLLRRNPAARFMGGAWVFPGGAVNGDESPDQAGLRELSEEAGIHIDAGL